MSHSSTYQADNIFARMLQGEIPCHTVYDDDVALAFLDIMPQANGHTLVIPKLPVRNMFDMPADAWGPYMERVQKVATAVKAGMGAEGITIQQFNESAGGQSVFHLHFHILPRWSGIGLRRHSAETEKQEVLKENAARIRAAF